MIKRILVATDGSPLARKAERFAVTLARQIGAAVDVVGVVDLSSLVLTGDIVIPAVRSAQAAMQTQALVKQAVTAQVERAAKACAKAGVKVRTTIRTGKPSDEIVKEAKRCGAGLIVLGSHGRSAIKAVVLGSVAYGVIHRSTRIPVLTVRS